MKTLSKRELDAIKAKKGAVVRRDKPKLQPEKPVHPPKQDSLATAAIAQANMDANARFEILVETLSANLKQDPEVPVTRLHIRRDRKGLIESIDVERTLGASPRN